MPVPDDYYVEPVKKKIYTPLPEDKYQVMVYDVNAIRELNFKKTEEVDKLDFVFVVLTNNKTQTTDEEGQPQEESTRGRRLWRKIPRSFSPGGKYKASLFYELMCAIEGKKLAEDELFKVNPNTLIGRQLCVFLTIDGDWNKIESFLKVDKELDPLPTINDQEEVSDSEAEKIAKAVDPATPSEGNSSNPDDFIKGLEEDQKKEEAEKASKE